jgi:hypothetical protein
MARYAARFSASLLLRWNSGVPATKENPSYSRMTFDIRLGRKAD